MAAFTFGGTTADDRIAAMKARRDKAIAAAAQAYLRARLAADHEYQNSLGNLRASQPQSEVVNAEIATGFDVEQADDAAIKSGTKLYTFDDAMSIDPKDPHSPLADAKKIDPKATIEVLRAIHNHQLIVGMTLDEANKALGGSGDRVGAQASGIETYEWKEIAFRPLSGFGNNLSGGESYVRKITQASFANGRLANFASN